ncbi:MAG: glutamate-1-semialdehyde 2,1-aminomutase [Kordiimonadaceae bacterium]|nr:glutamate-1-semialdehyde 2,1-aminomutase [Kordiimonadaceae bacterium]
MGQKLDKNIADPFTENAPKDTLRLSEAHAVIPGGAHTYSKGDDQFPVTAPQYIERAKGCRVYDAEGRGYIDWMMGLRSAPLGYGHAAVLAAVQEQIVKGPNFSRPSQLEAQVAHKLLSFVSQHDMVKFAKNGSNVTTAAVKLARAYTGRDLVLCCADHPFFSFDDWFIGSTACSLGVPDATKALTKTFKYNDLASLEQLFENHKGHVACLIMEAATDTAPLDGYLKGVAALCKKSGAVFILDEMITGFRFAAGGAAEYFGLAPDLATYGKGLGNGFSVAALAGRRDIMEQGGILPGRERLFLLSATHGAENHSLAAALAAMQLYETDDVIARLWQVGAAMKGLINRTAERAGLKAYVEASGFDCNPVFTCRNKAEKPDPAYRTLFLQEMAREGVLINFLAPSIAHDADAFEGTRTALEKTMERYSLALTNGADRYLEGPIIRPVFRSIN